MCLIEVSVSYLLSDTYLAAHVEKKRTVRSDRYRYFVAGNVRSRGRCLVSPRDWMFWLTTNVLAKAFTGALFFSFEERTTRRVYVHARVYICCHFVFFSTVRMCLCTHSIPEQVLTER